jgi:hypothetical protein
VVIGFVLYLLVGVASSRDAWARGAYGFDLGWVLVSVFVSRPIALVLRGVRPTLGQRLRRLLSFAPCFALGGVAHYALVRLRVDPGAGPLIVFALSSCALLVLLVVYTVAFPYEDTFGPFEEKPRLVWRRSVRGAGFVVASVVIAFAAVPLVLDWGGAAGGVELGPLQTWLYRDSLLVYLFLGARVLLPSIWLRARGALGGRRVG